jgi:hypothetical protein
MSRTTPWLAAMAVTAMMALPTTAGAVLVQGSSSGTFSNLNYSGLAPAVISPANTLKWGSNIFFDNRSSLVIENVAINEAGPTSANDVVIARFSWVNRLNPFADQDFTVDATVNFNFTTPAAASSEAFTFRIETNGLSPDTLSITVNSAPIAFALAGIAVSDIKFREVGPGSFSGSTWSHPDTGLSVLELTADFTRVPEPATLAVFGAALAGLGFARRRRSA